MFIAMNRFKIDPAFEADFGKTPAQVPAERPSRTRSTVFLCWRVPP